jgi:ubiquinone/menaquinone biosynthesis C-methylase UbiE
MDIINSNANQARMIGMHDRWADQYDADYFAHFGIYHQVSLDNLKRFLPENHDALILDAGGGTGIWAMEAAKLGFSVVLNDISEGMLSVARAKFANQVFHDRVTIQQGDICSMPEFSDGQFDMVICQGDPLSYCKDHKAAVSELSRVVHTGGIVIASVDNRLSVMNWLKQTDDPAVVDQLLQSGEIQVPNDRETAGYILHAFTPQEISALFESNSLSVERIIGKTVISHRLDLKNSKSPAIQDWLLKLELQYCDDPAYIPWGGHLEIVGRKR